MKKEKKGMRNDKISREIPLKEKLSEEALSEEK
jgi:hypothetical protein